MTSFSPAVTSRRALLAILLSACAWASPSRAAEPDSQTAANGGWVLAPKRPPHGRDIKPGQLSQNEKRQKFSELTRLRRTLKRAAFFERFKRLKALEEKFGIYDVATLLDNGDVSKRVDIVIVSAGFSKRDAAAVNARAEKLKSALLRIDPFRNYPAYINVHRVNVNDGSLATARIKTKVEQKILTCDRRTARQYAQHAPDADLVVVLCNISGVRATGGRQVITIDASLNLGRTFVHEMGHAFAGLSDEYVDRTVTGRFPLFTAERERSNPTGYINVTREGNPQRVKWHYWIPPAWPAAYEINRLPTGRQVGCFEGAFYRAKGVWRPERRCLMRHGRDYCVVCFEHVERRFYRLIAPIDQASPRRATVGLWADGRMTFKARVITTVSSGRTSFGSFRVTWYVDGKVQSARATGLKTSLTVSARKLKPGRHEVGLRVDFSNRRIRRDYGWLSSSRGWIVDVSSRPRPHFRGPDRVTGSVGKEITFDIEIKNPDPGSFRLEALDLPEGSTFKNGHFAWTPAKVHQGAWQPRFVLSDKLRTVEKAVEIVVFNPSGRNYKPVVPAAQEQSVAEGETLEFPVEVIELDGDNLVFRSSNLPAGAELDAYDGVVRWRPGPSQAGRYEIDIEVFDGRHRRVSAKVKIVVEDRPSRGGAGFDILQVLRSPKARRRAEALKGLDSYAQIFVLLEAARLLRDRSPEVKRTAREVLRSLEQSADSTFMGLMVRDLVPHVWHFTDDPETLTWLQQLGGKGRRKSRYRRKLQLELKRIKQYNLIRGVGR